MDSLPEEAGGGPAAVLSRLRTEFHACLAARADELCELADAVLCADKPVKNLAALSLAPEHRRGHGALYDAVNHGRISITRLRAPRSRTETACAPLCLTTFWSASCAMRKRHSARSGGIAGTRA